MIWVRYGHGLSVDSRVWRELAYVAGGLWLIGQVCRYVIDQLHRRIDRASHGLERINRAWSWTMTSHSSHVTVSCIHRSPHTACCYTFCSLFHPHFSLLLWCKLRPLMSVTPESCQLYWALCFSNIAILQVMLVQFPVISLLYTPVCDVSELQSLLLRRDRLQLLTLWVKLPPINEYSALSSTRVDNISCNP